MAGIIHQGFYEALAAGLLEGTPDVRCYIGMEAYSYDADAIHIDDGTLDEYDGANYEALDLTGVSTSYDTASNQWRLYATSGTFGVNPLGVPTSDASAVAITLYVDGNPANDYMLGSIITALGVTAGGVMRLNIPDTGLIFGRQVT